MTLELLMGLPVMALAANLVIQITFDAAFMSAMTVATLEAARESAAAFPQTVPFVDPDGEPSSDPRDADDIADRIALIVERRLRILGMSVRPPVRGESSTSPGVRILIRRAGQVAERGNPQIPLRPLPNAALPDELEIVIAVRMASLSATPESSANSNRWMGSNVLQCAARAPLE